MKLRLIQIRDTLADSFWFLPLLMALIAGGLALGSVALDHAIGSAWVKDIGWVWSGRADGARGVLSVVAGSVMTVVSIVFSLTVTTLAQTSSHYGPRVLRNFTSDRFVQFTLGTFIATFVYCLLVLRTVRSAEETEFVPYLSVNLGVLLSLTSLAVLIFFLHHISQSIQAENLIASIGTDFQRTIPVLFPETIGQPADMSGSKPPAPPGQEDWDTARTVISGQHGYLQRIDDDELMRLAKRHSLILKLEYRPGDFVARGFTLLRVRSSQPLSEPIERRLQDCFSLGLYRTPHQDALYSLQQLAEIAAHALSPGINEPFTALSCIDWLGASLSAVAQRDFPTPYRVDDSGNIRVLAPTPSFGEMAGTAFDQIRVYGASNPHVILHLLQAIIAIAPEVRRESDREVLRNQVALIREDATQIYNEDDRRRVADRLESALRALANSKEA